MPVPVETSFQDMNRSDALVAEIQRYADELEDIFDRITKCQVVVEGPHHRHRQGELCRVRIQLAVPQCQLSAGQTPHDKHQHKDPLIAVRDAFDAIRRQLIDYVNDGTCNANSSGETPHGTIVKICLPNGPDFPEQGFGYISTCEGREVYFDADSLLDLEFQRLELGSEVQFAEEQEDDGPHASSVWLPGQQLHSVS